jgi:lipopolysaccharide/colanic/teichoic acid biosynthesis glycosyltransferase
MDPCANGGAKRIGDLVGGCLLWMLASPVLLALALLVRLVIGSPVFFRQVRPGLGGRPFVMYKFRTMTDARDGSGALLPDAQRLTPLGRWLRRSSLDELPELYNVIAGDMSLVGPRPLLMEYLPLYTPEQARRHSVKPGITGWAQINGRNAISWEAKFALDNWYVENGSLKVDALILGRTLLRVLRGGDVNQPGQATAAKFTGTAPAKALDAPPAGSPGQEGQGK